MVYGARLRLVNAACIRITMKKTKGKKTDALDFRKTNSKAILF